VVHIRAAAPGDGDALAELHARSRAVYYRAGGHEVADHPDQEYREVWRKMVDDPRIAVLAATLGDEIVGVITVDADAVLRPERLTRTVYGSRGSSSIRAGGPSVSEAL
jgi:hypothetical protein